MRVAPGVEAFGGGGFRVAGQRYEGSILILDDVVSPWPVKKLVDLSPQAFDEVFRLGLEGAEFILLGTGPRLAPAPRPVREAVQRAGLGLEVMTTKEACRLYNFLAEEGRRVAAALIAV